MLQADAILDRVSGIARDLKLVNLAPQIAACRNLLHASHGIDAAVFGRFKAGKSSFLNHLVGRDVLPIGVVLLTAVITRLRYGDAERSEMRFQNGAVKSIPLGDIGLYVGENENPENWKQVAAVVVELPALKALAPLQIVDTPGLGSAFVHNTEAAMKWLPNVGAALVAVSSDAPLSERDLGLLDELHRHTPRIVLLLTKADLLTETQRAEVLAFVRQQMRRKWNTELPVFFYSLKGELAELKKALIEQFLIPLRQARGAASEQILRHKEALGVGLTPRELVLEVREPSAPPVDVGYGFDVALEIAGCLVPMILFRRAIERSLLRKARYEVEKNLSRLAAAWRDRVAAAMTELTSQAEHRALSELGALDL